MELNINLPMDGSSERNLGMEQFARLANAKLTALAELGVRDATLEGGDKVVIDPEAQVARYATRGAEMVRTPNLVQLTFVHPQAVTEDVAQELRQSAKTRTQVIAGAIVGMDQPRFSELESTLKVSEKK